MRFPTDVKLLWECVERAYRMMCGISSQLGEHRLRTKYNDIEKANLAYRKQRKHTHKQTQKMIIDCLHCWIRYSVKSADSCVFILTKSC